MFNAFLCIKNGHIQARVLETENEHIQTTQFVYENSSQPLCFGELEVLN